MSNLIVTIISIVLIAVAAVMATYYGGVAFSNQTPIAWANTIITQSTQIYGAGQMYSGNNGGADYSTFGMHELLTSNYLEQWPNLAMNPPQPNAGNLATNEYDASYGNATGCYNLNGYKGNISRALCTINGTNTVTWYFKLNDPFNNICNGGNSPGYGFEDVRYTNHPIVQICKALNNIMQKVPAGSTPAPSGVPYVPLGTTDVGCTIAGGSSTHGLADASGNAQINYCTMLYSSGTNIQQILFSFAN